MISHVNMWLSQKSYFFKDVIVQPGINFSDEPPPADGHTGAAGKHVLVISSAGGTYPRGGPLQEYLHLNHIICIDILIFIDNF